MIKQNNCSFLFVLLVLLCSSFSVLAQTDDTEIQIVDTYFVVAKSGLSLRAATGERAVRLDVIPWGTKIKVLESWPTAWTNWRKVSYKGKEGFASRDYLTSIEVPMENMKFMNGFPSLK
ncbi:SH3 domain-containing protein [Salibacteraceae bacterium]|nr:SH3 domain-containing protein [Salibacteraceae bacterium]HAQ71542.1 hypothetical protein [Flavobacteriales bacterium]